MITSRIDFRTPAAGFDQPLGMWLGCHERVHRMCGLLNRVYEHVSTHGANHEAGVSAHAVLRYFDEAAHRHHDDEEHDLFPRLLTQLKGRARTPVSRAIDHLLADHAALAQQWENLRPSLASIERGEVPVLNIEEAKSFDIGYRQHIALEESVLAPAMQRAFNEATWREIGRGMAARRGVDWESLGK